VSGPEAEGKVAWLVTGEDPSLLAEEVGKLVRRLLGDAERSLAVEDFGTDDDEEAVVAAAVDASQTPPFLSDRRVVVLRGAGRFNADQLAPVVRYLEEPLPTTRLVVVGDGGTFPAKVAGAFRASPVAEVMTTDVAAREAHGWFSGRLGHAPVKFLAPAAAVVEQHLGEDLGRLSALLAALEAAYGHGAVIGPEELGPYLGRPGSVPPWDLTDAIDKGQTELALPLLHRVMEAGGRHPLVVLAILQRHFGNILRAQSPAITSEGQAAEALGIAKGRSTFPARKALDSARRLGPRGAGDAMIALANAELALKGKVDWPAELVLEVLVARLCRLSRSSAGSGGTRPANTVRRASGARR
jgi:DNA polymerase III subunit delta